MYENCIFNCEVCGGTVEKKETDTPPECCGKPMKKSESIEPCDMSATAEHARLEQAGDPCDDGRGAAE